MVQDELFLEKPTLFESAELQALTEEIGRSLLSYLLQPPFTYEASIFGAMHFLHRRHLLIVESIVVDGIRLVKLVKGNFARYRRRYSRTTSTADYPAVYSEKLVRFKLTRKQIATSFWHTPGLDSD